MPLYYYLSDVIAEVYGYQYVRQATWIMFFCCIIFSALIALVIYLPSSANTLASNYTSYGLTHIFRAVFGGTLITIFVATFINSYILSKWKILLNGKYFWLRSLTASGIGELIQVTSEVFILYSGVIPFTQVVHMVLPTYLLHILLNIFIVIPGSLLVIALKATEGKEVYDNNISFNPFKFAVENKNDKLKKVKDIITN